MGGAKALAGEAGMDEETAKAYGSLVHMLLEHLAPLGTSQRDGAATQLLGNIAPETAASALAEALGVLDHPDLAHAFAPTTLAEVPVTAELGAERLYGIIDRLIIDETRVLAVDFKSNRTIPDSATNCPEGLLRQMGAYAHALQTIYPDRTIETAILWTHAATLMLLPQDIVNAALHRTGYLDAAPVPS